MRFDFLPQYCGSLFGSHGLRMALLAAAMPGPVRAEDLETAIRDAVNYSPLLTSARSRVDGCSAELTIARAEGLPTVDGSLRYSKELAQGSQASDGIAVGATVNVPLFRGGSVRNAIKATESQCDASSASIGEVEDEVALDVVAVVGAAHREFVDAEGVVERVGAGLDALAAAGAVCAGGVGVDCGLGGVAAGSSEEAEGEQGQEATQGIHSMRVGVAVVTRQRFVTVSSQIRSPRSVFVARLWGRR